MINLTKENLESIVLGIKKMFMLDTTNSATALKDKMYICQAIINLLNLCFGEYNTQLLLRFCINHPKNHFNNINDLYQYFSDPHSHLVNENSALTVNQLAKLFPEESMFKVFQDLVNQHLNT